jgi:hypothetical protein
MQMMLAFVRFVDVPQMLRVLAEINRSCDDSAPGLAHSADGNTEYQGQRLNEMKVPDLRRLARLLHLQQSGNKETLVERVRQSVDAAGPVPW